MSDQNNEVNGPKAAFQKMADQKMKVDTTEPETTLWQGGYSPKAMIGTWILSILFTIVIIVACYFLGGREDLGIAARTINLIGGIAVLGWWLI